MDSNVNPVDPGAPWGTYNQQGEVTRAPAKPRREPELQISLFPNFPMAGHKGIRLLVQNKALSDIPLLTTLGSVAEGLVRKRHALELDLSEVDSISSMCIGVIMNVHLAATQEGVPFQVQAHGEIKEKLDLCSVGSVINLKG